MPKLRFENGITVTLDSEPTPQDVEEIAASLGLNKLSALSDIAEIKEPSRGGVFGKVLESDYQHGERNVLGNIFERPAAAIRAAIQGKGYTSGAVNPTNVPRFQDVALDAYYDKVPDFPGKTLLGNVVSAGGMAADIATDPSSLIGIMGGLSPTTKTAAQAVMATKPAQAVSRFANLPISKTAPGRMVTAPFRAVKSSVDYLKKSGADYVTTKVAPKAYQIYQDNVSKFTPYIQRFAKDKLGISEGTINTIKKFGIDLTSEVRKLYNDSTDAIYQKIGAGIAKKDALVEEAYTKASRNMGNKDLIPLDRTYKSMQGFLRRIGYIDQTGNETSLVKGMAQDSPLKQILNHYQSLKPGAGMANTPGGINKFQWKLLRENLSKAWRTEKTFKREITTMLDSLHSDAEKAGMYGIKNARSLARQNFDAEENILSNSLIKERKLDKFQSLSQVEKRQLMDIEKYTGEKFVDDLDRLTADRALDKLREYNPKRFAIDLNSAVNKTWTETIKNEYRDLLGTKTDEIFNDIVAHRKGLNIRSGLKTAGTGAAGAVGIGTVYNIGKKFAGQ